MSNATGAFGLRPLRRKDGSPYNGATIPAYISATYATALFIGDPVLLSPTTGEKDTTGHYQTINKCGGGDAAVVWGVIQSFEPLVTDLSKNYNPASTERIANVIVDKNVIFGIRGSGDGAPDKNFIGSNAVMKAATSGSTVTGLSGMVLDEGGGGGAAPDANQSYPLLIIGIRNKEDNELADYAEYEVLLNTAENAVGDILGVKAA